MSSKELFEKQNQEKNGRLDFMFQEDQHEQAKENQDEFEHRFSSNGYEDSRNYGRCDDYPSNPYGY